MDVQTELKKVTIVNPTKENEIKPEKPNIFLDTDLTNGHGIVLDSSHKWDGLIVGLYFTADWSTPARSYTVTLSKYHDDIVKIENTFPIVAISCDKTEEQFGITCRNLHPDWWVLPFDSPLKQTLIKEYHVYVVPRLVIIHSTGVLVTKNGRSDIESKGLYCLQTWSSST